MVVPVESQDGVASKFFSLLKGSGASRQSVALQYTDGSAGAPSNMSRNELVAKLVSTCLGLAVSFTITYFGFKYLANVLDPTRLEKKEAQRRAEKLMKRIGVAGVKLTEYELCIASNLVDPLGMTTSWNDIGGLADTVQEIRETVILPFKRHKLFAASNLLQAPKGVLLYGPPGCGKTMIAKAMAKEAGARFINLQVSSLVDKWYGESQKRAEAVFSLAIKLQPTIIFIDEIDSFLRSRTSTDHEATAMIKTQFMSFWDGLMTDSRCQIMIVGATNRAQDVDAAILRRMPCMFFIGHPNASQRRHILSLILCGENVEYSVDLQQIAEETEGFSGSDLRELCRNAALYALRELLCSEQSNAPVEAELVDQDFSVEDGGVDGAVGEDGGAAEQHESFSDAAGLRAISMVDMQKALLKMKQSKLITLVASQQIDLD